MKRGIVWAVIGVLANVAPVASQELLVSGASSLTNSFRALGAAFERRNPKSKAVFNFSASDVLLRQILEGAPVDVFASADQEAMDKAAQGQVIDRSTRRDFASNRLVLAVPWKSNRILTSMDDLRANEVVRIAIGHPATVPAGRYAKAALEQQGAWGALREKYVFTQNVRQSLDYLARGEVDAGFVYATDAAIMKDRVKIAFEVPGQQAILYPIAVTTVSKQPGAARGFIALVLSRDGQKILKRHGFSMLHPNAAPMP